MTTAQRYRWLWKPLVFIAASLPLLQMVAGAFGLGGATLGADPVKALVHRCGLTALQLLWITLCITPLRQLTGNNDLLRLRRMLGLFSAFYALLHFTAYAWLDQDLNLAAIWADIVKRPYITIGLAALLLMLPLAVTSTNGWIRRLKRRWQSLHRLVYVIALLGVWHFWWQVKKDFREPLAYAALLALLLAWRVIWPRWRARATSKSVSATVPERT
jgi:sulfoxide reductase heme-binding subunit YedZ